MNYLISTIWFSIYIYNPFTAHVFSILLWLTTNYNKLSIFLLFFPKNIHFILDYGISLNKVIHLFLEMLELYILYMNDLDIINIYI